MTEVELLKAVDLAQARRLLQASLFEPRVYARQAGAAAGVDAFAHYFVEGWKAGFAPNAVFDGRWYLAQNPEVAEAGVNPLLHYATVGEAQGRDPSSLFDVDWYRRVHAAEAPLAHYLARRFGPFSPIPEFDAAYYLKANPDVAAAGLDPFIHYMRFGYREFRRPSASFNPRLYANRRLARDRAANPLVDLRAGRRQGAGEPEPAASAGAFEWVKLHTRPGPRFESRAPAEAGAPQAMTLAFYLPQFHRIPENDAWWGEGFTEWTQLARGQPRFAGHYQPRIPGSLGFYDLTDPDVMRAQAKLARGAGLAGFVFYQYDFDGRRLLEKPLENFLASPDIEIGFCLMWANENWTRRWDGAAENVLIAQCYDPNDEARRCDDWARHFRDPRYIRLGGRPLLMIYRASLIPDAAATVARWRKLLAGRHGEDPLFVMAQCFDDVDPRPLGFDAAVEFPPHKLTRGLSEVYNELDIFDEAFEAHAFAYDDLVAASLAEPEPDFALIKTAVPSWDNDARRQGQGLTLVGATPLKYERWLAELVARARPLQGQPLVCINAWNEWCEGAYLEPDVHLGWANLNATARAVRGLRRERATLVAVGETPAMRQVARRFATGFGIAVVASQPVDAEALQRAAAVLFADDELKRRTLAALSLTDAAKYAVAAPVSDEAEARELFDRLAPDIAKVSVVVINRGAGGVARRLQSLFAQTHPVAEILVLDVGSTEASFAAIDDAARAADRDVTVALDEAIGFVPALRRAAEMAAGRLVWAVEGDGDADPECLARLVAPLSADPRISFAFCNSRLRAGQRRRAPFADETFQGADFAQRYLADASRIGSLGAVIWRREALASAAEAQDWLGILRRAATAPDARVAFVADDLSFPVSAGQPPA